MKVLVDGDACPVKDIIISISKKFNIDVYLFINDSHIYNSDYLKVFNVASGKDVADFQIVNHSSEGDIVVTNDYGLAAMALAKKTIPLSFSGLIYNSMNIDSMLMNRHIGMKTRKSGKYTKGPKKRTKEDDDNFIKVFTALIEKYI